MTDNKEVLATIRGLLDAIPPPNEQRDWISPWERQVYASQPTDLGDHVAEFENDSDARHAVMCVNTVRRIRELLENRGGNGDN